MPEHRVHGVLQLVMTCFVRMTQGEQARPTQLAQDEVRYVPRRLDPVLDTNLRKTLLPASHVRSELCPRCRERVVQAGPVTVAAVHGVRHGDALKDGCTELMSRRMPEGIFDG